MSFKIDGFLSNDANTWIVRSRANYGKLFHFAEQINQLGMRIRSSFQPSTNSPEQLLAVLLFTRALQSFQGTIILGERGLASDARCLVRSCVETTILIAGIVTIEKFPDKLVESHYKHRLSAANALLSDPDSRSELTGDQVLKLEELVNEINASYPNKKIREIKYEEIARKAGLLSIYNTVYRSTSGDAAHPTLNALNRHLKADKNGLIEATVFKPDWTDFDDTILAGAFAFLYCMEAITTIFQSSSFYDEFRVLREQYKLLCESDKIDKPSQE